jgi:beta-1,4-mannosyltransferase
MHNLVKKSESLWQECVKIANSQSVIASELYDEPNDHYVLAYGPVAQRNFFQALLYSAHKHFNVSILPICDLSLCGNIPWPGKVICHFHWIHDKTKNSMTMAEADAAVVYWEKLLKRIKEHGHKILWTVHNVMPHECAWVEHDKKIHQMMADAADAIHAMANDSAKLTEQYYTLDERKMFVIPHPTYEGFQPDEISRAEARAKLQIGEEEFVFLSFGAIMEYKGYDRLMAAYDQLRGKTLKKTRLIIAGLPSDKSLVNKIASWGSGKADVFLDMTPVPHDKLQVYFRSADLAVCPYTRTMNSGAAMMAVTFDVPVLGPNSGGFLDIEAYGCGITFDNTSNSALYERMRFLVGNLMFSTEGIGNAKKDLNPLTVSEFFFRNIKQVIT